jgi:hypothetical protein
MNFDALLSRGLELIHLYPYVAAGGAVLLLLFLYKSPKAFFKLALLVAVIVAFLYAVNLFMGATTSGTRSTRQGIERSQPPE